MDLEREYSPSSVVGGSSAPFEAQYRRLSAAAADSVSDRLVTLPGGTLLAQSPNPDAPLMVFVHGGYWQALSAAESMFPAAELVGLGWSYAAVEYAVAPKSTIPKMIADCTQALVELAAHRHGRLVLVGHSAGAHLAATIALTQRSPLLVDEVILISGIYDLRPLVDTSINAALGLDPRRAAALSPMLTAATPGPKVTVAWGEIETAEFKRQSREYAAHLAQHGVAVETVECAGRNHFDLVFDLANQRSVLGAVTRSETV